MTEAGIMRWKEDEGLSVSGASDWTLETCSEGPLEDYDQRYCSSSTMVCLCLHWSILPQNMQPSDLRKTP